MYRVLDKDSIYDQLPTNSNLINYSILKEFHSPIAFRSFSIKYVVRGHEKYTVNGNVFHVRTGEYLLANAFCKGSVEVDSKQEVAGICIDVSPTLISDVVASFLCPESSTPDPALDRFFNTPDFLENTYAAGHTHLGQYLTSVGRSLQQNPFAEHNFGSEFYYTLAEKITADHHEICSRVNAIKALRTSTRKDLYRKVTRAKEYMDQCYAQPLNIAAIAAQASLSEYHFFRLFKSVYGITPNQYLVKKRLETAQTFLKKGYDPVSFVAVQVGFADVFSFSKAFKKHFGISPSAILPRN